MVDYLGKDIPKLGFGLMRLPHVDGDIDIEQLKQMVDMFLERGFTYFDTAYGYEGSEAAIAEALVQRYPRFSYQLATKLPAWMAKTKKDAEQMFWTSLERTGAEYFDFYLLHNIGGHRTQSFDEYGIWDFLAKRKEEGLIHHLGFSLHDKASLLDEVLTKHPETEFVQLQINYADWDNPFIEAQKCYQTARKHKKPIIVMEPVKGGNLVALPPAAIETLKALDPKASLASWAIRFAASLDDVITVLSGMSDLAQMQDNTSYMVDPKPLNEKELAAIKTVRAEINRLPAIPCTDCRYCLPVCEQKVAIPGIFEAMNLNLVYGNETGSRFSYRWNTSGSDSAPASACIECGNCESACTQGIAIIQELKKARAIFEPKG